MNSLILSAFARFLFALMLLVSLYILYRGHNDPGGGFVGGLMAAAGFAILALAGGVRVARRMARLHPAAMMGTGLLLALLSGVPGLVNRGSFLAHWWFHAGDFHSGTALVFDIGVYLAVLGGVLAVILRFYEEQPEA